ncbi:MAG: hypothetical protein ABI759_02030, partial [Candidatus Solibacter sp.]
GQVLLDVGQYFNIETLLSGHLEIVGDQPLASSLTFRTRYGLATVGGDGPAVQGTDQSIPLVLPYLRNTGSNWTGIAVVNQTSGPAYVTLDAVSSEGVAVARVQRRLEAKAQFVFNINEVVGSWTGEGYLRLTSDAPVSGLQITGGGDPGTTSFAGWGGQRRFGTQLFVPHIAEIDDWQSRISLINISPVEGVLTVEAIDSQGRQLAVTTLRLASGRQVIAPVAELLHLRGVGGGSLRITSTVQLAGANLFANSVGLAAVAANPAASEETRRIPSSRIASQLVSATKGAEITFPYDPNDPFLSGFSLSIPPDAIDEDTTVTVDLYRPDAPYFKPTIRTSAVPCPPPSRRVTLPTTSAAPHSYSACELWQRAYSAAKHQYRQL